MVKHTHSKALLATHTICNALQWCVTHLLDRLDVILSKDTILRSIETNEEEKKAIHMTLKHTRFYPLSQHKIGGFMVQFSGIDYSKIQRVYVRFAHILQTQFLLRPTDFGLDEDISFTMDLVMYRLIRNAFMPKFDNYVSQVGVPLSLTCHSIMNLTQKQVTCIKNQMGNGDMLLTCSGVYNNEMTL
jgi:hypothetical protein